MIDQVQDFHSDLIATVDWRSAGRVLGDHLNRMGFDQFAYFETVKHAGRMQQTCCSNYPVEWRQRYLQKDYMAVDPVPAACANEVRPFRWGQKQKVRPTDKVARKVFGEARSFGIRAGVTAPVHMTNGSSALLSATSSASERETLRLCDAHVDTLHLIVCRFYDHVRAYGVDPAKSDDEMVGDDRTAIVRLTTRERECLLWTAEGKSAWEVSVILGISEGTVVFHLKNAMRKFGVCSKYHAVVKAIMMGIIHPSRVVATDILNLTRYVA